MSLVHTDFHHCANGAYLCTFLDDSSRKVLAAGEFKAETIKNALVVLRKVCWNYGILWYSIKAVLTDHGTQFCSNRKGKVNFSMHEQVVFALEGHGHILCRLGIRRRMESWRFFIIFMMSIGLGLVVWMSCVLV